ncbi:TPA: cysteine methyltransferase [Candidatus Nomurabacteria bacterium]|nr:cysteine methyltransferase [Candidatus Nomurabacteria bacterium]
MKKSIKTFSDRVLEAVFAIPSGRVTTYGRIARACGAGPMASQSITAILGKAYEKGDKNIPFHRIVYADGKIWISDEYRAKRLKLYKQEGIEIDKNNKIKNFEEVLFEY